MEKQHFGPDGTRLLLDIVDVTLQREHRCNCARKQCYLGFESNTALFLEVKIIIQKEYEYTLV